MYVTYRIGKEKLFPVEKNGTEITEETNQSLDKFRDETESYCGQICIIWSGIIPMPENGEWWSR